MRFTYFLIDPECKGREGKKGANYNTNNTRLIQIDRPVPKRKKYASTPFRPKVCKYNTTHGSSPQRQNELANLFVALFLFCLQA